MLPSTPIDPQLYEFCQGQPVFQNSSLKSLTSPTILSWFPETIVWTIISIVSASAQKWIDYLPLPLLLNWPRFSALVALKMGWPLWLKCFTISAATLCHSPSSLAASVAFHFTSEPSPRNDQSPKAMILRVFIYNCWFSTSDLIWFWRRFAHHWLMTTETTHKVCTVFLELHFASSNNQCQKFHSAPHLPSTWRRPTRHTSQIHLALCRAKCSEGPQDTEETPEDNPSHNEAFPRAKCPRKPTSLQIS